MDHIYELLWFGVGLLLFWTLILILNVILPLRRYGVEVKPFYLVYKSSKLTDLLGKAAYKRRMLWRSLSNLSVVFGVGLMAYALYFLSDNLLRYIRPGTTGVSLLPVLPGITIRLYWLPHLLLAASIGLIVHEAAHGLAAMSENIQLKSAGLIFAFVFLAGFVEPDEKEFEKASSISKVRVVSAGSFMNLVAFLVAVSIMLATFISTPSGIVVVNVSENGCAYQAGLRRWDVIYSINGTLNGIPHLLLNLTEGTTLVMDTSRGRIIVRVDNLHNRSIGISPPYLFYYPSRLGVGPSIDVQLYLVLFWSEIVLSSLAVLNMLPLFPFDGDKFLFYVLNRFTLRGREFRIIYNVLSLSLIVGNMVLSLLKHGPFLL